MVLSDGMVHFMKIKKKKKKNLPKLSCGFKSSECIFCVLKTLFNIVEERFKKIVEL